MKRKTSKLRRILFNSLTAMSLILALAACWLLIRSIGRVEILSAGYWNPITQGATYRGFSLLTSNGTAQFGVHTFAEREPSNPYKAGYDFGLHSDRADSSGTVRSIFSTDFGREYRVPEMFSEPYRLDRMYRVPLWTMIMSFCALPAGRAAVMLRRKTARSPGHCPACGYDTRANPSRCSECGKEIERSENAKTSERDSTRQASTPSP